MREIKFKFWDRVDKKFITWPENMYIAGNGKIFTYANIETDIGEKEIIPIQYTGLKDKSGKEIYEGDIISFSTSQTQHFKGFVSWDDCQFITEVFYEKHDSLGKIFKGYEHQHKYSYSHYNFSSDLWDIEIIGNIYENPGLAE